MQNNSQNKMTVEPVGPLMFRIGLPIALSMILQAAYNVVDSAYLARMPVGGEDALTALSLDCMRIVSLGFLFAGLCIAFQGIFQALECGIQSLVIFLCRQVLFVLPPVWLLTRTVTGAADVSRVWWPLALGEAATLVVALIMFRSVYRKKVCDLH